MATPFTIRRMRLSDHDAVGELTVAAYVADGYLTAQDDYAGELRDSAARDREAEVWVAVGPDDDVLGVVTFCPVGSSYREVAVEDEGEFRSLAVSPLAQGAGLGRTLAQHCVDRARELGYGGVALCSMDRMTPAHRLYERMGFVRDPGRDWSPRPGVLLLGFALRF